MFSDTNPKLADTNNVLLAKIAQAVTEGGGGGSVSDPLTLNAIHALSTLTVGGKNVETKPEHNDAAYAATFDLDMTAEAFFTVELTGNITFTTSNIAAGRSKTVRILGDSVTRTLTFPAGWIFVGAAAPADIAASKTGVLTITAFGVADSTIVAAYAVEP